MEIEMVLTAQGGDFEGEHELEGRQPTVALVTGGDQQPQSEELGVVLPEQLITDPEAAEDNLFSEPMNNSGWLYFILGRNQRNPIWRLGFLSGFNLYTAILIGVLLYLDDLPRAQAPYHYPMAMLIMSVGAPTVVAAIGLFVSFWFSSVPNKHTNWITGLTVANFITVWGLQAIFWAQKWGTVY